MCREEAVSFLAGISQLVEANDGEVNRKAAEEAAVAAAQTKAKSYKEPLQRFATLEGLNVGKGKGKTNTQFPSTIPPVRYNGIPKNPNTTEAVQAVTALAARARDAADQDQQRLQAADASG